MIPLVNLKRQYKFLETEINQAISSICENGDFILGKALTEFEESWAEYLGASHAIGVANGTDALHLILKSYGIGAGDEVIVPANTFIATALAVTHSGAHPVLVDCEERTALVNLQKLKAVITQKTKAIIAVHLYGQPVDMDPLLRLACEYKLKVIEDAAQAHGAEYHGRKCGVLADAAAFSFYPSKNLSCYGDGGAVVTNDPNLAQEVRLLRNWGSQEKYIHERIGFNSRLDTIHAAVLKIKLQYLDSWNEKRRCLAAIYRNELSARNDEIELFEEQEDFKHVYHLFVVRIKGERRDLILKELWEKGIQAGVHYPVPIHQQEPYREGHVKSNSQLIVTENLSKEILSLPICPYTSDEEVLQVAQELKRAVLASRLSVSL